MFANFAIFLAIALISLSTWAKSGYLTCTIVVPDHNGGGAQAKVVGELGNMTKLSGSNLESSAVNFQFKNDDGKEWIFPGFFYLGSSIDADIVLQILATLNGREHRLHMDANLNLRNQFILSDIDYSVICDLTE